MCQYYGAANTRKISMNYENISLKEIAYISAKVFFYILIKIVHDALECGGQLILTSFFLKKKNVPFSFLGVVVSVFHMHEVN